MKYLFNAASCPTKVLFNQILLHVPLRSCLIRYFVFMFYHVCNHAFCFSDSEAADLARMVSPTSSQDDQDQESSVEQKKKVLPCDMYKLQHFYLSKLIGTIISKII